MFISAKYSTVMNIPQIVYSSSLWETFALFTVFSSLHKAAVNNDEQFF